MSQNKILYSVIRIKKELESINIFYFKQSTPKSTTSNKSNIEATQNSPLISETEEPVFVIIEVELYSPLISCKLETDLSNM